MKKVIFLLFAFFTFVSSSAQTEVAGVTIPNNVSFEGEKMVLNGAGVREKFWMDMYAGALYLASPTSDSKGIINSDKPKAIKLHIVSGLITSEKMIEAINEGFENATRGKTGPISSEITKFKSLFSEKINKNDIFDIVYLPSKGVKVYRNGKEAGTIQGKEFSKALFGIWLSEKPADEHLKKAMLGKK